MKNNNNNSKNRKPSRKVRNSELQRPHQSREPKTGFKIAARHKENCSLATQAIFENFLNPYQSEVSVVPKFSQSYYAVANSNNEYVTYTAAEPVAIRSTFSVKVGNQTTFPINNMIIPAHGQLFYNNSSRHVFTQDVMSATVSTAAYNANWLNYTGNSIQTTTARGLPSNSSLAEYFSCCLAVKLKIKANHLPPTQKKGSLTILVGQGVIPTDAAALRNNPRTMTVDADVTSDEGIEIFCPGNGYLDISTTTLTAPPASSNSMTPYIFIAFNGVSDSSGEAVFDMTLEACGYYCGWKVPTRKTLHISNEAWFCALACFREATKDATISFKGDRREIRKIAEKAANRHETAKVPNIILEGIKFGASHLAKYASQNFPELLSLLF